MCTVSTILVGAVLYGSAPLYDDSYMSITCTSLLHTRAVGMFDAINYTIMTVYKFKEVMAATIHFVPCKVVRSSSREICCEDNDVPHAIRYSQTAVICPLEEADALWGYNPETLKGQVWHISTPIVDGGFESPNFKEGYVVNCVVYDSISL